MNDDAFCNHCREVTETKEWDCTKCGLSKPMPLEERMRKFPTVHGDNCHGCGNPWFFKQDDGKHCTTCGKIRP
jgi:NAD-dependent dihydropyrimidine dehydrogenase PreA subunit